MKVSLGNLGSSKSIKKFSILVVAEQISTLISELNSLFHTVIICNSEKDALQLFDEKGSDLILIDVDIEGLNPISLIQKFRTAVYDLPIALLTDIEDTSKLTAMMSAGITQCLFKPISIEHLQFALYDMVRQYQDKLTAKELYHTQEKEKNNAIITTVAETIIQDIPLPMFAFNDEGEILFVNQHLTKLFADKKLSTKQNITLDNIETIFENMNDAKSFMALRGGKHLDIQYNYKSERSKKIFIPTKFVAKPNILDTNIHYNVVVLHDIAPILMQIKVMTYHQQKADNYKEVIEELLARKVFKESSKAIIQKVSVTSTTTTTIFDDRLSDKEVMLLRKSVQYKISAIDYVKSLDYESYEEVYELSSTESELQSAIDIFAQESSQATLLKIAQLFEIYGNIVKSLIEFIDLGNAICSLSSFIYDLEEESINQHTKMINMLVQNLLEDIMQWRVNIFEDKIAIDIHYLDSSIFSSVLQFQVNISSDATSNDETDFELF